MHAFLPLIEEPVPNPHYDVPDEQDLDNGVAPRHTATPIYVPLVEEFDVETETCAGCGRAIEVDVVRGKFVTYEAESLTVMARTIRHKCMVH